MRFFSAIGATSKSLVARLVQAGVEGVTYPFGPTGRICTVLVHSALVAKHIGPGCTIALATKALPLCAAGRAVFFFVKTLPQKVDADQEAMDSIWEFDPPGELGESGAWTVVRELAQCMSKGGACLPDDCEMETLPLHELAVRLCFRFDDGQNHPDTDEKVEGGSKVDDSLLDKLAKQLHYANLVYEAAEDPGILDMLKDDGFGLNFFKAEAEWESGGAHKPAFFVACNTEAKQLLISIRGTSEMQDVMADIVAVPEEYDDTGKQAHSGMGQAAMWLLELILPLAKALSKAGYTILLTGHSLGAGAAAMLGLSLRRRGIKSVEAFGFATPPCMARELAQECREFFHSVAQRDDVVARFGPQSLAALHRDLREYDWEAASKERGPHNPMLGNMSKLAKAVNKIRSLSSNKEEGDEAAKAEKMEQLEQKLQDYQPLIPGKVVFFYRARPVLKATKAPDLQGALVDGGCPQLQKLHINALMVADHVIPSYFTALGRPNPVEQRREEEKRKQEEEEQEKERKQEQQENSSDS